jgi:hypothetical protein
LRVTVLPETLAICRLAPDAEGPAWARGGFCSLTRTGEELSIVCPGDSVPADVRAEHGFRALKVCGPLDFSLTGVLASLAVPLARAGISIFALSTYDTDYILVRGEQLAAALTVLRDAEHEVL